jgi:hypothetical protein
VELLLAAGADKNLKSNESGFTTLILASCNGHARVVELLFAAGADTNLQGNVTKRLHSRETATAGEGGVTRTVIKSLRGGRGGRQRVFAASSLGGAAREQHAAMEAGGGAVAAPPPKGQL